MLILVPYHQGMGDKTKVFVQKLGTERVLISELTLALYPGSETRCDITRPLRSFSSLKDGAIFRPFPLLMLSLDELSREGALAAIQHTLEHAVAKADDWLQGRREDNAKTHPLSDFSTIFAPNHPGKNCAMLLTNSARDAFSRYSTEEDPVKRRDDLRAFWQEQVKLELNKFLGQRPQQDVGIETLAERFVARKGIAQIRDKMLAGEGGEHNLALLEKKRGQVENLLKRMHPAKAYLVSSKGTEFILADELGTVVPSAATWAAVATKNKVFFCTAALDDSAAAAKILDEECDHQFAYSLGVKKYPLAIEAVTHLRENPECAAMKILQESSPSSYNSSPTKYSVDYLIPEFLHDVSILATKRAAEIEQTTGKKDKELFGQLDREMRRDIGDLWEVRKHMDEEIKAWAYASGVMHDPQKQVAPESWEKRLDFSITDGSRSGRTR
jgi:hypothetical protein